MDGEAVIRALLLADPTVSATVAARVYPSVIPESETLPAIATIPISTVDEPYLDALSTVKRIRARVEVMVLGTDLTALEALVRACVKACRYQRGTIAGVSVHLVLRDVLAERARDPETGIYSHAIDFLVIYTEA